MTKRVWIAVVIAFLAIGAALGWSFWSSRPAKTSEPTPTTTSAEYRCSGSKSISVSQGTDSATLSLSDGRTVTLARVPTAGGTRYASPTGSVVFWVKEYSAFLEESGETTYQGCRVYPLPF